MVILLIHSTYPGCVKHVLRPDNDKHLNSGWVVKHLDFFTRTNGDLVV